MTDIPDISLYVTDSTNRSHIIRTSGAHDSYIIGRGFEENTPDSGTIKIPDQLVSRKHCSLTWTESGQWLLEDLGSTNGTFVEGAPLTGPALLARGDTFKIGGSILRLDFALPPGDQDGPDQANDATEVAPMAMQPRKAPNERLAGLTRREREVLDLLVTGMTNKEIARLLQISHRTIEAHRANIMEKTKAKSFPHLIRMTLNE